METGIPEWREARIEGLPMHRCRLRLHRFNLFDNLLEIVAPLQEGVG